MAATDNSKFLSKTQYEVTLQRLAQVTGRTLGADANNAFKADLSSSDRVLGSWTHPTATATTIAAANGKVLSAITVDSYGHVTSVSSKTLAAADIPDLSATYQTKYGFTISGTSGATYNLATISSNASNGNTAFGYFSDGVLPVSHGGTGKASWTQYGIVYASATNALSQIAVPTGASTTYWLKCVTNASKVPTYSLSTIGKADVGLGNVENTALSTWAGSSNITTLGTVTTGTWNASTIGVTKGGTGLTSIAKGAILYASAANTLAALAANGTSTVKILSQTSNNAPAWTQLYVGRTVVSTSAANTTLLGVNGFTNTATAGTASDKSLVVWDSTNNAWHFQGNIYADGWVSAAGVSESGGGGGGTSGLYVVDAWNDIDVSDGDQVLGSVLGANINNRLTTLEGKATAVSFTQTLTSGKQIGTITIDGTGTNLYAPASYALSEISGTDDLQAIEGLTGTSGALVKTAANTWSLKSISDSSSAGALSSSSTNFVTERDVYYGLPKINNAHNYTSNSTYYAPTTGGTSGYILKANGSTSAPTWATVDSLMGDYAKTTAVNQAIADAIAGVTSFEYSVVTSLPTTGVKGTIYLVAHTHGTQDIYDEYIWVGDKYEKIGNTDIDLSGYWATTDLVAITATENTTLLNSYFPVS